MTRQELEKWLCEQSLEFSSVKSQKIEFAKIPEMSSIFWKFVKGNQRPPTQKEFIKYYREETFEHEAISQLKLEDVFALEARLKRTYPSLIRDLHFGMCLKELAKRSEVICDPHYDLNYDADVIVCNSGKVFAANLLTKTKRAVEFREGKSKSRKQLSGINYMEIPLDMSENKVCGDFKLYSIVHIHKFAKFVSDSVDSKK